MKNILVSTVPVQNQFNTGRNKLFQIVLVIGVGCSEKPSALASPPPKKKPRKKGIAVNSFMLLSILIFCSTVPGSDYMNSYAMS